MTTETITVFDTTLRDGEQSPGCSMNTAEKLDVAKALVELGVDVIEAGFPIASPGDFEAVQKIAQEFGVSHTTVQHQVERLGRHCLLLHERLRPKRAPTEPPRQSERPCTP